MASLSHSTVIVVGGGIVGLCIALMAQSNGYLVTVIDSGDASASSVAAGMIAPALEAINDPDPVLSYSRLKTAQAAWAEFDGAGEAALTTHTLLLSDFPDEAAATLSGMGVAFTSTDAGLSIDGEGLVEASGLLQSLRDRLSLIIAKVDAVTAHSVHLDDGRSLVADKVVIAGGYASKSLAATVPALSSLTPIKGHILSIPAQMAGVIRASYGYMAGGPNEARIGATMQTGQADTEIEPDRVAALKGVGERLGADMTAARAHTGVRASTPDNWPLIGKDEASGVWVATGMRRNGFIFAPFAAKALVAAWQGAPLAEADAYDPNRFLNRR